MIARRDVIRNAVVTSLFGGEGSAGQMSDRSAADITAALKEIRTALEAPQAFQEIMPVRLKIVEFLRAQGKFPDYMDVGIDLWFAAYDWHVRHLQPITLGRDQNGRHTLQFVQTALVLRPDLVQSFIGVPYDAR